MNSNIKRISDYIDKLNSGQKPKEHGNPPDSEFQKLSGTVRLARLMKEPELPDSGYPKRLAGYVAKQISRRPATKAKKVWYTGTAIAAVLALAVALNFIFPLLGSTNIVFAMEKAFQEVKAYHGVIEVVLMNENREEFIQSKREVWADSEGRYWVKEIDGFNKGLITANNGVTKWQIHPDEKKVYLFQAYPDPYRFTLEIGNEINDVRNAVEVKAAGEETIAGRTATILEVSPQGGQTYKIWVDRETKLPLQKETAVQNALQYRVTYTEIELNASMPAGIMEYLPPEGYSTVETNPEQIVNTVDEAEKLAGFTPIIPETVPDKYELSGISVAAGNTSVKIHYRHKEKQNTVIFLQNKAKETFRPASSAVLAKIGENPAEILSPVSETSGVLSAGLYAGITDISSIRWQQDGFEYAVAGYASIDELILFTGSITGKAVEIPAESKEHISGPQIEVPLNMEAEQNEQKSVDGGHTPWRLDPVFVAQVFVSLEMSPDGIKGDYPVAYEDLKVIYNDGIEAVVEVPVDAPIAKVYLERLIRRDSTGIWTVVGYDRAQNQ